MRLVMPAAPRLIWASEILGYIEAELTGENAIKIYARRGIDLNNHS
jgi:hypothetical protein